VGAAIGYGIGRIMAAVTGPASTHDYTQSDTPENISADEAEGFHAQVMDELKNQGAIGADENNIELVNKYAFKDKSGELHKYSSLNAAIEAKSRVGGVWLGGRTIDNSKILVFRNAYSTNISSIDLGVSGIVDFNYVGYGRGYKAGLFVVGHELGHRIYKSASNDYILEQKANHYGKSIVDKGFR
jgi:hypothetical protein